jgi:murein DD-endopeptidase MepM/ murein hydrolase activator NlpD
MALGAIASLSVGAMAVVHSRPAGVGVANAPTLSALYAAPVERIETHVLGSGETLSGVFSRASISGQDFADLLLGMREFMNPRRLSDGVEITIRRWTHDDSPRAVEVRVNPDSTIRLTHSHYGWSGALALTPVVADTVYTAGSIEQGRNLYQALVYDEASDLPAEERVQLVYALAEIYEFKLDFTREIQPGDSYRLVYEREARPDGSARSRRILAAEMVSQGHAYPAVWFAAGPDKAGYYDREGRPLASGFSRYPVQYRITSSFNPRRYHPVLGINRPHYGTDFGAPLGTDVRPTADGTVIFAGWSNGYGNLVKIKHPNGYETRYAHLKSIARGVRSGVHVRQKQTILGYVGSTGLATAPHLHYELRKGGVAIDVRTAKLPDAPPIAPGYRTDFLRLAGERVALLDAHTGQLLADGGSPAPVIAEELDR